MKILLSTLSATFVLIILFVVFFGSSIQINPKQSVLGSMDIEANIATSSQKFWENSFTVIKAPYSTTTSTFYGGGYLDSVVLEGTQTTVSKMILWNATSTTDIASTTLVTFPTSVVAGTYRYGAAFTRGLILQILGSNVATSTINYH